MKNVIGTKKIILEQQKKEKARKKAALSYVIPFVAVLLLLLLFLLPIIRFTNYKNELTESTSVFKSIYNNTNLAREVLFSTSTENDEVYMAFSRLVLICALISFAVFAIGFISSLTYMLTGLSFLNYPEEKVKQRRLFLTFIPNKATVFILSFLCVLPSFFPKLLSLLIERILIVYTKTDITVVIVAFAIWLISLIAFLLIKEGKKKEFDMFAGNYHENEPDIDNSAEESAERANEILKILENNKKK